MRPTLYRAILTPPFTRVTRSGRRRTARRRRAPRVTTTSATLVVLASLWAAPALANPGTAGRCDFNGDGYDDLAIGVPNENVSGNDAAGAINVIYGTNDGLASAWDQVFHQDSADVEGGVEEGDAFGASLACADFNDDGWDDLAVGAPNESISGERNAGMVHVIFGTPYGLNATLIDDQVLHLDVFGTEPASAGDILGSSLAADDFDGDGFADLAIGIPGWDEDEHNAGAIAVVYGSTAGLSTVGSSFYHQDSVSVVDEVGERDRYGDVLVAGNFDGDGFADLAVGIPLDDYDADYGNSGKIHVMYGSSSGVTASGDQRFQPSPTYVHGLFGAALVSGDFDDDGYDDLAVGAPGTVVADEEGAGAVYVLYGAYSGLTLTGNQYWTQSGSISGVPEAFDRFGHALAAGDFDDDGVDDLAIGVPGEAIGSEGQAGMVNVLLGISGTGLSSVGSTSWQQDTDGVDGVAVAGDTFGRTLSCGDFDGDGLSDLAVGVPGDYISGLDAVGTVHVLMGDSPAFGDDEIWYQGSSDIEGAPEANDMFAGPTASTGVYRIPYVDGTDVEVGGDVYNHTLRMDMWGVGSGEHTLVAAADGIVRVVVDTNFETPDGNNTANNAVWIEHPNGEWTKYTHMATDSVPDSVVVGQPISAGTVIGIESDVGQAQGEHLHFHVLALDDPASGEKVGNYRMPRFCGVRGGIMAAGEIYTADDC